MNNEIKKITKRTLLVTVTLLVLLSPFYATPTTANANSQFEPRYGGTLRIAYGADPVSFNGFVNYWGTTDSILGNVMNKLMTYDSLYNMVGELLVGYPVVTSEPGYPSVYTLELEKNIRWFKGF